MGFPAPEFLGPFVGGFIVVAVCILWKFRTGLNKKLVTASVRMVLQLLFVGYYYLKVLFEYDDP